MAHILCCGITDCRTINYPPLRRDCYIDFLRAIGLLLLIVAHTNPPLWLKIARCFDVPLMVFVSAICYHPVKEGYIAYCVKRFKRIYIPTLVFLCLYYFIRMIFYKVPLSNIAGSLLLFNTPALGYIWIMRVFIMIALLNPFLYLLVSKGGVVVTSLISIGIIAINYCLEMAIDYIDLSFMKVALDKTLLYAVGYSAVAVVGLKIRDFTQKQVCTLILIFSVIFIFTMLFYGLKGLPINPNAYKYPPQSLFLLYGIIVSLLLWSIRPKISKYVNSKQFAYLSRNSMWIYLWHILLAYAVATYADNHSLWFVRFCFILVAALGLNAVYQYIIKMLPQNISRAIG